MPEEWADFVGVPHDTKRPVSFLTFADPRFAQVSVAGRVCVCVCVCVSIACVSQFCYRAWNTSADWRCLRTVWVTAHLTRQSAPSSVPLQIRDMVAGLDYAFPNSPKIGEPSAKWSVCRLS